MNGCLLLVVVGVVLTLVLLIIHLVLVFTVERENRAALLRHLPKKGEPPVDTRDYKYKPSIVRMQMRRYRDASTRDLAKVLVSRPGMSVVIGVLLVGFAIYLNRFSALYYYSAEERIRADIVAGRIPRSALHVTPQIGLMQLGKSPRSMVVQSLRIRGYHYDSREQFSYQTGLQVSSDSAVKPDCLKAPILWIGSSAAVVACKSRIQVFHKLDPIISEPVG